MEQQVEHESDAFKKSIYEVFISHVRECQEDFHKNKVDITVIWSEMSKKGAQIKQNTDLDKRIKEGDEAREKLITHNLRFVAQQAEKYEHVSSGGMDFKDILQEGCIGLMKAVDGFDPDRGAALITYARWWIHQKIRDALAKKLRNIRIPTGFMGSIYKIHSVIKKFRQANDRDPDHEEISEMTGISLKRVKNLLKVSLGTVSLDAPMSDDSQSFVEVTADERATNPFEAASNNNML